MTNMTMHNALQNNPDGSKVYQASMCLIMQTERDIAPWKKTAPQTTQELNSYIAIKMVSRIHGVPVTQKAIMPNRFQMLRNQVFTQSLIQVWASSESKIGKIRNIIEEQKGEAM